MLGNPELERLRRPNPRQRSIGLRAIFSLALCGFLGACANSVVVKGEIPNPLVERMPINAAMSYTEKLKTYTYTEEEKKRTLKSLDFGQAQVDMFDKIFGSILNLVGLESPDKDLIIEPEILDFQYTAPRETKLNLYEVWIKYRLKLSRADESKLADWTIKGYGKTPTGMLTSPATAFNAATNIALRDVGAQLSIRMPNQSAIKRVLAAKEGEQEAIEIEGGENLAGGSEFAETTTADIEAQSTAEIEAEVDSVIDNALADNEVEKELDPSEEVTE